MKLSWGTQKIVVFENASARLDIVLHDDEGSVLIVVENKIGARFQTHATRSFDSSESAQQDSRHQLATYGRWLSAERAGSVWGGALVLLTHSSPVPERFGTGDEIYGVKCQSVLKWTEVCRWLWECKIPITAQGQPVRNEPSVWRVLAGELATLLEEWEMSTDVMTQFDLAAAEIFAQSSDRLNRTFETLYARIAASFEGLATYAHDTWNFDSTGAVMYDFAYLEEPQEKKGKGWYVGWGIRFPTKSQWWNELGPDLPATNHAYVCIEVERKGFPGFRKTHIVNTWRVDRVIVW